MVIYSSSSQLLLVLWKTLLTCCGGIRELSRVKKLARELASLPSAADEGGILLNLSDIVADPL